MGKEYPPLTAAEATVDGRPLTPEEVGPPQPPVGELIEEFAELRDHLKDERKRFRELENQLKADMVALETAILEKQRELGLTSLSTKSLTAFQTEKTYVRVGHWDTFIDFVAKSKNFQCLEKRCAKLACIELFEEGTVPADIGLDKETEICVQIRKK